MGLAVSWAAPGNSGAADVGLLGYTLAYRVADSGGAWTELAHDTLATTATLVPDPATPATRCSLYSARWTRRTSRAWSSQPQLFGQQRALWM